MGYITSNQGRPIQGVSQQPEKNRLKGQCSVSDNFRPDIVRGLITRQSTEMSGELTTASLDLDTKWYYYNRGTGEEYFISIEKSTGKLRAYSPDGTEHIVNVEDESETEYLAVSNPKTSLKLITIGDYTFILNTIKNVTVSSAFSPTISKQAIVYVQFIDYAQDVTIILDDVEVATFKAPDGSATNHTEGVVPGHVAAKLYDALHGISAGPTQYGSWSGTDISATWDLVLDKNTILLSKKSGEDFTIIVDDDKGNENSVAIKGKIENTSILPGTAPDGFLVEVDPPGAQSSENANFWLKAEKTDADHVTWRETIAPSISISFNTITMPHVLVRESIFEGIATFTLRRGEWEEREVGNEDTNPFPSFIDSDNPKPIQSIGIFQNRLFFTSSEAIIMTRSNNFFNFFRETAQANLPTDPVDIYADTKQINLLKSSLFFDGDLIFFSENGQFILTGDKAITRDNATLRKVTSFECNLNVNPVASGDNIFFCFNYGQFSGVREFFTDSITDTKRARPITDHVKQYLIGSPDIIASSTSLNILAIKTEDADNILYIYDWLWQGTEKVQSAWGRWIFPEDDKILYFEFTEEVLWLAIARDSNAVYIEKIDLGDPNDFGLPFNIRIDRKIRQQMLKTTLETKIVWRTIDPYPLMDLDNMIVVRSTGGYEEYEGVPIEIYRPDTPDDYLYTDEELGPGTGNVNVFIGEKISCIYEPTNPVALDEEGQALNLDRLTIGSFFLNYIQSGDLTAIVEDNYGTQRSYDLTNRVFGSPENLVGFAPLVPGQHRIPIRKKADAYTLTYTVESHIPLQVRDFEFDGNLNRRGRRI